MQKSSPRAHVVKTFNTVLAQVLANAVAGARSLPSILVVCNHALANADVVQLVWDVGFTAFDSGPFTNARYLEPPAEPGIQLAYAGGPLQ